MLDEWFGLHRHRRPAVADAARDSDKPVDEIREIRADVESNRAAAGFTARHRR